MPGEAVNAFETFGAAHLVTIGVIGAVAAGLPIWSRRAGSAAVTRWICRAIVAAMLVNEVVYFAHGLATMRAAKFVQDRLPLHVCDMAVFLTAWTLWRRSQYVYEVAYYWGLGATFQAILTPNLEQAFPSYAFVRYFITHGGIVIGVLFATFALRMRPLRRSILRVFVLTNLYMGVVGLADWLLGGNYMFLREPPQGVSPFFFLPWPWYIAFLELLGVTLCLALYSPFFVADRLRK